jgi:hypothetical protein
MQPRFRAMILSMPCPSGQREGTVLGQLQITFAHLALTKYSVVNPWAFWDVFKDFDGQKMDVKEHQDCQEFFVSCCVFGFWFAAAAASIHFPQLSPHADGLTCIRVPSP